jgi:hypothetical protein
MKRLFLWLHSRPVSLARILFGGWLLVCLTAVLACVVVWKFF